MIEVFEWRELPTALRRVRNIALACVEKRLVRNCTRHHQPSVCHEHTVRIGSPALLHAIRRFSMCLAWRQDDY